jgi:c-di-GMP-binding flagellar brake protein YcgR
VPANRSRTERWRDVLHQIFERGGGLEFTVDRGEPLDAGTGAGPNDIVWRVKILHLDEQFITVEPPAAVGRSLNFDIGTQIVVVMAVGQNRWMFRSTISAADSQRSSRGTLERVLKVNMPTQVERCARRNFYRVSTAEIHLPSVTVWPVRSAESAIPAEVANAVQVRAAQRGQATLSLDAFTQVLPEVGTPFTAKLMNVGGGGIGLIVSKENASNLDQGRLFWVRIDLGNSGGTPLGLTARLAHTHIDSEHNTYVGMAFEFSHNAAHRDFIVEQFTRYVESVMAPTRISKAA